MQLDVAIVGGGIAGASVAAFLTPGQRVAILEAEDQPGYHTTGRSAAFYSETYGGPGIQPLTTASRSFFAHPPDGVADGPLLRPRGALHVAAAGAEARLDALEAEFAGSGVRLERLDRAGVLALAPTLRPEWSGAGLWEPDCQDIDVAALHAGFLRMARAAGGQLLTGARATAAQRNAHGWRLATSIGEVRARILVNAAGAWADDLASLAGARPLGIQPLRRTIAQVAVQPAPMASHPLTLDAAGSWYFKPERDRLWVSPHDEQPDVARDAQPEELDVAIALDRLEAATTFRIVRLERSWAGLRCFAPDRLPVLGWDPETAGLFWCAGQGGFGIQTAPAAGMLCAALIEGRAPPEGPVAWGAMAARYSPSRLAARSG